MRQGKGGGGYGHYFMGSLLLQCDAHGLEVQGLQWWTQL